MKYTRNSPDFTLKISSLYNQLETPNYLGTLAPFGDVSAEYIKSWQSQYQADSDNIWGITK